MKIVSFISQKGGVGKNHLGNSPADRVAYSDSEASPPRNSKQRGRGEQREKSINSISGLVDLWGCQLIRPRHEQAKSPVPIS